MKGQQQAKMRMALMGQVLISYIAGYEKPRSMVGPMYRQKLKIRLFKNQSPEKLAAAVAKRERKGKFRFNQYDSSLTNYHPYHRLVSDTPEWLKQRISDI